MKKILLLLALAALVGCDRNASTPPAAGTNSMSDEVPSTYAATNSMDKAVNTPPPAAAEADTNNPSPTP